MSTIPTKITEEAFDYHIRPCLSTAKRGFVSKIPLFKVFNYILYRLHTGCQWHQLPLAPDLHDPEKSEISYHAVYYHFRKWSLDGSLEAVWQLSILSVQEELDLSELNLDGTHSVAKKGGASVAYQGRKKAKTSNILPIMDANGYIVASTDVASTDIVEGNHHDAFDLKPQLQSAFKFLKRLGFDIHGAFFNADSAFDTKEARKTCFNHGLVPSIPENKRNRKRAKKGPRKGVPVSTTRKFTSGALWPNGHLLG